LALLASAHRFFCSLCCAVLCTCALCSLCALSSLLCSALWLHSQSLSLFLMCP
jgi:hypothetical protein